jgi:DNA-binding HxlR family transcriptional regulator
MNTMNSKDTKAQVGTERIHGSRKETCEGPCPIGKMIELLSGRWAFPVLYQLLQADGPIRFGQLQRSVGQVTQKELTKTLRTFEERGLVKRKVFAEVPPRVEYRLTALGASLGEPLCGLARWAETHMKEITASIAVPRLSQPAARSP